MFTFTLISLAVAMTGVRSRECDEIRSHPVTDGILDVPGLDDDTGCWNIFLSDNEPYSGVLIEILDLGVEAGVNLTFKGYEEYGYGSKTKEPSCWFWTFNKTCLFNSKELNSRCNGHAHFISFHGPVVLELRAPTKSFTSWRPLFGIKYSYITPESSLLFSCTALNACPKVDKGSNSAADNATMTVPSMGETKCPHLYAGALIAVDVFLSIILLIQGVIHSRCCRPTPSPKYCHLDEEGKGEVMSRDVKDSTGDQPSSCPDSVSQETTDCHAGGDSAQSSHAGVVMQHAPAVETAVSSASDINAVDDAAADKPLDASESGPSG